MTNGEARMTKEARSSNDLSGTGDVGASLFVLHASSFFRHSCFVIRHCVCGCSLLAATLTTHAALVPQSLHSRSGQFIVSGLPMLTRSWAVSTTAVSFVRLDPALVAVSCEGIKAALLDTLGLQDRWQGS